MDEKDRLILDVLKENSSLSHREIAKKTHIPLTTVHNRIKKMQKEKLIKKYTIQLDSEKLGLGLAAYIMVTVNQHIAGKKISQQEIAKLIKKFSCVESADIVTGQTDLLVKVRCANIKDLDNFITKDLRSIEGIDKTISMIVLEEI
ncbi:MAG: AsnC family transcriptional regulator [Candidatus Diapherotrites archaeon CG08_land_8_20_14_0_20_34_12]|nr:MAG: AsnC family transcriptional regulator [Candidatus Diapherotrites archaeon CG08_land_8_20_14_0_20_34_12]